MRVLHVAQPVDGGVALYVLAACLDQRARGWDVAVACPSGGRLAADLERAGITRLAWAATRSPGPGSVGEARRLARIVAAYRPDLVHLHASKAGLAGRLLLRRPPTVFQPHGWSWLAVDGLLRRASLAWERIAARRADLLVCVGDGEAEQGRLAGVRGRYTVVRNGVDRDRFRPADSAARDAARAAVGVAPGTPLAVCVGRVTRQKGQDVLLAAWPRVRDECPDAELVLVGDGDLLPGFRAAAPAGVRFAGAVTDVRTWLAAADVVVLPSRWEGLPLTALEAFATGRPVVASAVPGIAEVVPPNVGALVPVEDARALGVALAARLADPALARAEGAAALRHAARFDAKETFDRLVDSYERVVPFPVGAAA
jgi:glycosyltransferase involved in cell wall biosynthesis